MVSFCLLRPFAAALGAVLSTAGVAAGASQPVPSFPGAVGFGTATSGGRGGPLVAVTSLDDAGPGTLRWALEDLRGPRIVVFAVEGVIDLSRQIAARGKLTLLGNVGPGAGVTVTGSTIRIVGDDVIMRGMRIRPGDGPGQDKAARDALTIGSGERQVRRVVVDRNSFAWSTDEIVNVWHAASDVTISHNIIAEALRFAGHPKNRHSMGMLIGDGSTKITIFGNLFISNEFRNPSIAKADSVEVVNNYVYNYGQHALSLTPREGMFSQVHVVGNYFERGPSSGRQYGVRIEEGAGRYHLLDNISHDRPDNSYLEGAVASGRTPDVPVLGTPLGDTLSSGPVFQSSGVVAMPSGAVRSYVLANAGARHPHLDPVDARLLAEPQSRAGRLINAPSEAGDAPPVASAGNPPDRDGDFVPDDVERRLGSDPYAPDSHLSAPGSPYTPIELYAHELLTGG